MTTKVYIGVPTAEFARPAIFYDYVKFLEKPEGTIGSSFHTNSAAQNRNLIIDDALSQNCTHILFVDDDMAFPPNALMRLLAHDESVVGGLYFNKAYPHPPVLFDTAEDGELKRHYLHDGETGLIEVAACGFGFMLVNTNVFEYLEMPFVRHGEIQKDKRNEDIDFCLRLGEEGFVIHCDLNVVVGHMGLATFWPSYKDGKWYTAVDTGRDKFPMFPQKTGEVVTSLSKLGPIQEVEGY